MPFRPSLFMGLSLPALLAGTAAAAPTLDVYALAAGGQSVLGAVGGGFSCATYAPDPRSDRYNGSFLVSLPTDGPGCGVVTDVRSQIGSGSPQAVAANASVSFGTAGDPRVYNGAAAARATYGNLGVSTSGTYSGSADSFSVAGSGAGALQTDSFTFGGASGAGLFRATFTLDGSLQTRGRADNQIVVSYAVGNGPIYTAFRMQDSRGAYHFLTPTGYVASLPGITVSGDNSVGQLISGNASFTLDIPIFYGTPVDFTYTLWAGSLPTSSFGQSFASVAKSSFYTSLRLTGIEMFNSSGQAVPDFSVVSGSGTVYTSAGVVPEPGAAVLMLMGLLALATRAARRGGTPHLARAVTI